MPGLDDFVANVAKSGLVPPDRLRAACAASPRPGPDGAGAEQLARRLIAEGLLTDYQAGKLLKGATRGFLLGDYRILQPLGQGGIGKVFLAVRQSDGTRVALKVLPPRVAREKAYLLYRFRREAAISQRVKHPNLARTLDVGAEGDTYYMAMEFTPGRSLYDLAKGKDGRTLGVTEAARFFHKALDGLNAAHEAGLIHRDLKPSNLMMTPDGNAKVLDLGLARAIGEPAPPFPPEAVLGTLDYASPEQIADPALADRRSDLYSLGCTLHFALAGQPPFPGGSAVSKIYKQRLEQPPPLERIAPRVPPAFAAIVRKLMAKDPDRRYQTGPELQADLAPWAGAAGKSRA